MTRFEIKAARLDQWFFVLHVNGECRFVGEVLHGSKAEVKRAIEAVRLLALNDACYKTRTRRHDQHYFVLNDLTGNAVGSSDMCENKAGRDDAVRAVKKYAPKAPLWPA